MPSNATSRWIEQDGNTLKLFFEHKGGLASAPSSFLFAKRLPPLEAGTYTVELWRVEDGFGDPYNLFETSITLEIDRPLAESPWGSSSE